MIGRTGSVAIGTTVGLLFLVVGVATLAGYVPGLSLAPPSTACSTCVTSNFALSYLNFSLTVTLKDNSQAGSLISSSTTNGAPITGALYNVSWGGAGHPGSFGSATQVPVGQSASFVYGAGGKYNITETVYGFYTVAHGPRTQAQTVWVYAQSYQVVTIPATGNLTTGGCQGAALCPSVTQNFAWSQTGRATYAFTDYTTAVNAKITAVKWTFGDGVTTPVSVSAAGTYNHTTVHVYVTSGTFTVIENVTVQPTAGGSTITASAKTTVPVSVQPPPVGNTTTLNGSTNTTASSGVHFTLNLGGSVLTFAGLGILIALSVSTGRLTWATAGGVIGAVLGYIVGTVL